MKVDVTADGVTVTAQDLAPLLGLAPDIMQAAMRRGNVTTLFERGVDADAGRFRVTFRHGTTQIRLTCAENGNVISHVRTRVEK